MILTLIASATVTTLIITVTYIIVATFTKIDMEQFKHNLGSTAEDRVSGFKGILTGRCQYLNGCKQYRISPKVKADGVLPDERWVDEAQISIVEEATLKIPFNETGGPQNTPTGSM